MDRIARVMLSMTMLTIVAACSGGDEPSPPPGGPPSEASEATVEALTAPSAYADSLMVVASSDKLHTQLGRLSGTKLVSDGREGYLLFGPYAPIKAGSYSLVTEGNVDALPEGGRVRLDVASGKGKVIHASQEVVTAGELPILDVTLPENIGDLEVRIQVPKGSIVSVESYRLTKKN